MKSLPPEGFESEASTGFMFPAGGFFVLEAWRSFSKCAHFGLGVVKEVKV
jgi:hypothetical protein